MEMKKVLSKIEDRFILELCKRKRDNTYIVKLLESDSLDWKYIKKNTFKHKVAPVVFDTLLKIPLFYKQKKSLTAQVKKRIVAVIHDNHVYKTELTRILTALKRKKIECILMKGLSLDFYQLRMIGDLDILVKEDEIVEAINTLLKIDGYVFAEKDQGTSRIIRLCKDNLSEKSVQKVRSQLSWNHEFQLYNQELGVLVELHTNLFTNKPVESIDKLCNSINLFWQEKQYNEKLDCFTFSHEHSLILMCLHNAIKRNPSNSTFRLSILLDIDNLIAEGIIWDDFIEYCHNLEIDPYVYFSLKLTRALLCAEVPDTVLMALKSNCTRRQLFLARTHIKSVKSLYSNNIYYANLYRILSPFIYGRNYKNRIKWIFFIPVLFPSRERMAQLYNIRLESSLIYFTYLLLLNPLRCAVILAKKVYNR